MSTPSIVILTDSADLSRALARYVRCALHDECTCFFSTYETRSRLSREVFDAADLFILELFRSYGYRLRAEGLLVAENLSAHGKRCLILSSLTRGDGIDLPAYWDLASADPLAERIGRLLRDAGGQASSIATLGERFAQNCFTPVHDHGDSSG